LSKKESSIITYVVFDTKTGKIVHKHSCFDLEKEAYSECDPDEVMKLTAADPFTLSKVTDSDPDNLDILMTRELPEGFSRGIGYLVDIDSRKIIIKPKIKLSAEKKVLSGDGKDETVIEISIVNQDGRVVGSFNGTIKVSTTRGKLSAKGGLVEVRKGKGNITLTSVNETVDRVKVSAQSLEGKSLRDEIVLEFV